nr:xanthine dehydrogenase subunit XdhA [uncultured Anaerocolumna sp.]
MGVGKSINRVDAIEKVTGTAKYVEDMLPSNALIAKVLHSTIANGIVKSINIEEALKMPGVETILTCFDVPDVLYATSGHPLSLDPNHPDVKDKLILSKRVRYYGDDIAAVVADNALNAQKALEKIVVEYEEYEPLLTPQAAINNKISLHEQCPSNELSRMDFEIKDGEVDFYKGKFSDDPYIAGREDLKGTFFSVPPVHACHIENNSCFAYMEGKKMIVVTCNQVPHTLRRNVAEAIEMPIGDVKIIKPYLGGGFGNKQDTMYEPVAAFLSKKLGGRCVAILLTREETFVNTRTRHGMDIYASVEVDENGKIKRKGLKLNSNGGSYGTHRHSITAYAVTNFFELYPSGEIQIGESSTAYTNLPSAGALRGYGIPQIDFAMESQMDDIAKEKGWDPIDFRKKNIMKLGFRDPFDKFYVKSNGLEECIDKGRELIDWDKKRKEYDQFNKTSKDIKKGVGMAIFCYKTGVYPIQLENAACRMVLNEDGSIQVQIGATELGQGSDTVFAQMASEILTIPESKIHVISTQDTDITPYDSGAYASRQSYVTGGAVKKTALLMKEKIIGKAAAIAKISIDDLTIENENIIIEKTKEIISSIGNVATLINFINDSSQTEHITAETTYTCLSNCFAFGASFVDLEVDVPIGKIKISKIISLNDSGKILNPQLARGQVHGGVAMAVGYAIGEQLLFDSKTGKPLNNNLLDYKIPTSMDIPEMESHFVETYEPTGPYGNKALGEPPLIPQAPAIRNAVLHATGVSIYKLPMSPQNLVHEFIKAGLIEDGRE